MDSGFPIKSCVMVFFGLFIPSCDALDNYLPKESRIWTFQTSVANRTYFTVRASVNESRLPVPPTLLAKADSIHSLSIYIRSERKSLDFLSMSEWDNRFPNLQDLSLIKYGSQSSLFVSLFKSNISFLNVEPALHPLFPAEFQFDRLQQITIKSKALANSNLSLYLPNLEKLVVRVDNKFPNLAKFLRLRSLVLIFRRNSFLFRRIELRALSALEELHIVAVPYSNKPAIALIELPRLERFNLTVVWRDDEHDMLSDDWALSCDRLSGRMLEVRLLFVNLDVLHRCPEIMRCDECGPHLAQSLTLEFLFTDRKSGLLFQHILPPEFEIFNTTEVSLINVPVVFDNVSFDQFPFLETIEIQISYSTIFEDFSPIFRGFPFNGIMQSPKTKLVRIVLSQNCYELVDIVRQFDIHNRSMIIDVQCSSNSVFYRTRSPLLAKHQFSSMGSAPCTTNRVLVICSILIMLAYSAHLSSIDLD